MNNEAGEFNYNWIYLTDLAYKHKNIKDIHYLKKQIQPIVYPIRINSELHYNPHLVPFLLRFHHKIQHSFREIKFKINRMSADPFSFYTGGDRGLERLFTEKEKIIFSKQLNIFEKIRDKRKFDFISFEKHKKISVEIKDQQDQFVIDFVHKNIKSTNSQIYNDFTDLYLSNSSHFTLFDSYNHFSRAGKTDPRKDYNYRDWHQIALDDKCLLCRNDISDLPKFFYFCLTCVELIDLEIWEKNYNETARQNSENPNKKTNCMFFNCNHKVTEGHFCDRHRLDIFEASMARDSLFRRSYKEFNKEFVSVQNLYDNQSQSFNKKLVEYYLINQSLDLNNLVSVINIAPKEHQNKCHIMVMLLLFSEGSSIQSIEYLYEILDNHIQSKNYSSMYHSLVNTKIIDIVWPIIINENLDIHRNLAYFVLNDMYHQIETTDSLEFLSFHSSEVLSKLVQQNLFDEFLTLFTERLNKNKKYFFENLPRIKSNISQSFSELIYMGIQNLSDIKVKRKIRISQIPEYDFSCLYGLRSRDCKKEFAEFMLGLCENIDESIRKKYNIPLEKEKWKSETALFYKVKMKFPQLTVRHDYGPKWLKPQRLDIYIDELNVGFEYQGIQHQMPIEFFGGEMAFEQQQKRDKRKKKICVQHKCKLIFVYPEDDNELVDAKINQVANLIMNYKHC